jgi:trans-aconitate 2-methyltransferase
VATKFGRTFGHGLYTESMTDWDAARYDRVSNPQLEWGRRVIARLAPAPGERILDLGCGTGRLTAEIAVAVTNGRVAGLDPSAAMLTIARQAAPAVTSAVRSQIPWFLRGDGSALPFADAFDAVFSNATLHWVADHDAAFRSIFAALRPGGRLVAQCGGGPNLSRLYSRAASLMRTPYCSRFFDGWRDPWHFVQPDATRASLTQAGFAAIDVSLEQSPVTFTEPAAFAEFIGCVCVRHHLERLPSDLHARFLSELTTAASADDPPLTLDYWRLNIQARRPAA